MFAKLMFEKLMCGRWVGELWGLIILMCDTVPLMCDALMCDPHDEASLMPSLLTILDHPPMQIAARHYMPSLKGKSLTKKLHGEVQAAFQSRFGSYCGWWVLWLGWQ
jgi:hypothetical protein